MHRPKQMRLDPSSSVQLVTMVCQQVWCYDMHEGCVSNVAIGPMELCKHQNSIVFDADSPSMHQLVMKIEQEATRWKQAGIFKGDVEPMLHALATWANARS